MRIIDIDFNDGITFTFVDTTKQLNQIQFDEDLLSSCFGGGKPFKTKER